MARRPSRGRTFETALAQSTTPFVLSACELEKCDCRMADCPSTSTRGRLRRMLASLHGSESPHSLHASPSSRHSPASPSFSQHPRLASRRSSSSKSGQLRTSTHASSAMDAYSSHGSNTTYAVAETSAAGAVAPAPASMATAAASTEEDGTGAAAAAQAQAAAAATVANAAATTATFGEERAKRVTRGANGAPVELVSTKVGPDGVREVPARFEQCEVEDLIALICTSALCAVLSR